MKNHAIILASGTGSRFGGDVPKQFLKINGKTILELTVEKFSNIPLIDEITVVITPKYESLAESILSPYKKVSKILTGGVTRKESSYIGVFSIKDEANVLIHDCARPFVSERIIKDCIEALKKHSAICTAIEATDTVLKICEGKIIEIPERKNLMRAQTPQCFRLSLIKHAHTISKNDNDFTDDCGLIVKYGLEDVFIVQGDINNIKITYPNDIKGNKNEHI